MYIQLGNIKNHNIIYNIKVMKKFIILIILTIILFVTYIIYKQITYTHITDQLRIKFPFIIKGLSLEKQQRKNIQTITIIH